MEKFVAKLTGYDGQVVSREFGTLPRAISWLQGEGLAQFSGEAARGDVHAGTRIVWTKADLTTPELAEKMAKAEGHRWLANLGLHFNRRR